MKSRFALGCMVSVIALCGLAIFLVWRARTPPQIAEDFSQLPPTEQKARRAEAKQFVDQMRDLERAARRKEHKPFTIEITEQTLNTLLQDSLRTQKFPVRNLRAGLEPDQLILQGDVAYKGIDAIATLTGNVVAQEGALAYQVESLKIGGFNAPRELKRKAEQNISQQLNSLLKKAPGRVDRVTIAQEKLTIKGVTD